MTHPINGNWGISVTPDIQDLLERGSPVAIGVSGGKDSHAVAFRVSEYLDSISHAGPRLLIHSDLGRVEWKESLPVCELISRRLNLELVVVRRKAGDLIDRWETRWQNNVKRYLDLSCVKLILPWSTPGMRFCTSELKTDILSRKLVSLFPGQSIISVTGIRAAESPARAKAPVSSPQARLSRKGVIGWDWRPIIPWSTDDVFSYLKAKGETIHEAYTRYGCTRVSCVYCIMGSAGDLKAATTCVDNHEVFHEMVSLETRSTFGLQGHRWLGDVAPDLLSPEERDALAYAKLRAQRRVAAEARIPKHLLFTAGWPESVPSREEAKLLGDVRRAVCETIGVPATFTEPEAIIARYHSLMKKKQGDPECIGLFDALDLCSAAV